MYSVPPAGTSKSKTRRTAFSAESCFGSSVTPVAAWLNSTT